jgi:two-component system phosphate regulon response regulator PhoB
MAQMTILVVEDEEDILDLVEYNLKQAGFRVIRALNGNEAIIKVRTERPDMIVLDLMLPDIDGKEVCREIRRDERISHIPILILTARGDEIDRIVGFEIGADDYMVKPFSPRELVLRIQAILRRTLERRSSKAILRYPDLLIDAESYRVEVMGNSVYLTATEFRLLHELVMNAGKVLSRETLLDKVWGYSFEGYFRTVDTHIRRLRKKLGPVKDRIETLRGMGYRFRDE